MMGWDKAGKADKTDETDKADTNQEYTLHTNSSFLGFKSIISV